jgi:putative salt-induced outer membrane protein YdiY
VNYLRDDQADLDYRVTPGVLLGYALIKNDTTKLALDAGPAYTFEKQGGVTDSYASLFAAERFSHAFNERHTLTQSLEYTSELAEFENYSLVASLGVDTKISDRLIWRIAATYTYDNQPAAGLEKGDTGVTSMIAVKF